MFDKIVRYWLAAMAILAGVSIIFLFAGFRSVAMVGFITYSLLLAVGLIVGAIIGLIKH